MPEVTFLPMNVTCEAREGESILDVALTNDIPIQNACGGYCACTTCQILVENGGESVLSEMDDEELDRLESVATSFTAESRLGCQAQVRGDVTVKIVNLDD